MNRRKAMAIGLLALGPVGVAVVAKASDHNEPYTVNILEFNGSDRNNPTHLDRVDAGDIYGLYAWYDEVSQTVPVIVSLPGPVNGFPRVPLDDQQRAEMAQAGYQTPYGQQQQQNGGAPAPYPYVGGNFDEGAPNAYDPKVVYAVHFDADSGLLSGQFSDAEHTVYARYGYDRAHRAWALQVQGLPRANEAYADSWTDTVTVPVGQSITTDAGIRIVADIFDDPFYFDLDAFFDSLTPYGSPEATMRYRTDHDTLAGRNSKNIVIEFPSRLLRKRKFAHVHDQTNDLNVWATTARLP